MASLVRRVAVCGSNGVNNEPSDGLKEPHASSPPRGFPTSFNMGGTPLSSPLLERRPELTR